MQRRKDINQSTCSIPENIGDERDNVTFITSVEWGWKGNNIGLAVKPQPREANVCECKPGSEGTMCCIDNTCLVFAMEEECGSTCPAKKQCGNKRIQFQEWKDLEVVKTDCKGRGLVAKEPIHKGDFIVEYTGLAVTKDYLRGIKDDSYIMWAEKNVYIDARQKGSVARYINHSCEPNCIAKKWIVNGITRIGCFAVKDITRGDEITIDYRWNTCASKQNTVCACNTESCRGTIQQL